MIQVKPHHLHRYDPDWELAQKHGIANRTGVVKKIDTVSHDDQVCRCCGQHFEKEPVHLWAHSKQLQFLGFGFPLFYQFLKYCIVLLIIHIGCYCALSLQQAVEHNWNFCHDKTLGASITASTATSQVAHKCYTFMIELARIEDYQTTIELTIRCISFAIHLLALLYVRNLLTKMEGYYDERTTTLSDYALTIKGIDLPNGNVKKTIAQYIEKISGSTPPLIHQIILLPHFSRIQQLRHERKKILCQMRKFYSTHEVQENEQLEKKLQELDLINKQMVKSANQSFQQIQQDKLPVERAIIIFESETEKCRIKKLFRAASIHELRETFGHYWHLRIDEAPNPQEIIWQNFSIPKNTRGFRIFLGWVLSVLVLVAVFIAFYFILIAKSKLLQDATYNIIQHPSDSDYQNEYNGAVAIVFLLMFLVVLFNKLVLSFLFHKFTQIQLPSTVSTLQFSFALKYSLGLFFTTSIMSLAVEAIKFENYYTHPYGVVDQESIMFGMNAVFVPVFWLINPLRIYKLIKRKLKKGSKNMTQLEANELMEQDSYDLGKRFGQVIQTMWFVFLYSTLLPIGAVVSIFGLILYYWVDKYNLLRRSKVHGNVSGKFIRTSMLLLDFTLILQPVGALIFDEHLRDISTYPYLAANIVMICIAFAYIVIPKHHMIMFFNFELFKPEQRLYSQVKQDFDDHNYTTHHPLFKVLHTEHQNKDEIIRRLKTINSISKIEKKQINSPTSASNLLKKRTDLSNAELLNNTSV